VHVVHSLLKVKHHPASVCPGTARFCALFILGSREVFGVREDFEVKTVIAVDAAAFIGVIPKDFTAFLHAVFEVCPLRWCIFDILRGLGLLEDQTAPLPE
jgi:hypothetical protein